MSQSIPQEIKDAIINYYGTKDVQLTLIVLNIEDNEWNVFGTLVDQEFERKFLTAYMKYATAQTRKSVTIDAVIHPNDSRNN